MYLNINLCPCQNQGSSYRVPFSLAINVIRETENISLWTIRYSSYFIFTCYAKNEANK